MGDHIRQAALPLNSLLRRSLRLLCAAAFAALLAGWLCAPKAASLGSFSIEQVYLNVPEMDIFVNVTDSDGNPLDPTLVSAAGVEVHVGDEQVPTGNLAAAREPICYIVAVDDSAGEQVLGACCDALLQLLRTKGERDQLMLVTLAGTPRCVLPATSDAAAAGRAVRALQPGEGEPDLMQAAALVAGELGDNYQSIAPRKVLWVCTGARAAVSGLAALTAMAEEGAQQLGMPLTVFALLNEADTVAGLAEDLTGGTVQPVRPDGLPAVMAQKQQALAGALEIKTAIDEKFYGERLELVTVSVPSLGSAVKTTAAVYMGRRLTPPAVTAVEVTGRGELTVTFNQAVGQGENPLRYRVTSEDIWGWNVRVKSAESRDGGRTAVLHTEPLYAGSYTVSLRQMPSAMTAANVSDASQVFRFTVSDWPRDRSFYAARFRLPAALMALAVAVLALAGWLRRRRDRAAEQQAEAEHLLEQASAETAAELPGGWLTLYLRGPCTIGETRWSACVESSLLVGSDPAQCDLCLEDPRVKPQHAVFAVEGDQVTVCPLGDAEVQVNGAPIGDAHRLKNDDTIRIGRTTLRLVL